MAHLLLKAAAVAGIVYMLRRKPAQKEEQQDGPVSYETPVDMDFDVKFGPAVNAEQVQTNSVLVKAKVGNTSKQAVEMGVSAVIGELTVSIIPNAWIQKYGSMSTWTEQQLHSLPRLTVKLGDLVIPAGATKEVEKRLNYYGAMFGGTDSKGVWRMYIECTLAGEPYWNEIELKKDNA